MKLKFDNEPNLTEAVRWLFEGVADLYPWLEMINNKLEVILSDQDTLNAYVARILAAVNAISAEIAELKAQPAAAALDFTALESAVASTEALEPPPAAPAV